MNTVKKFQIKNGEFLMDGLPQTQEFVKGNTDYIAGFILRFQQALGKGGSATAVCQEENWAFNLSVDQVEFGRVASGNGAYVEGSNPPLNQLVEDLENLSIHN